MDLATIEPALCTLAASLTGVEVSCCVFENAPRPRHNGSLVVLSWVSRTGVGEDETLWTYASNADPLLEMTPAVKGPRRAVLQFAVEVTADQRPGYNAAALIERARTRLQRPSSHAALNAVTLAFAGVGAARQADYRADGRMVSRSLFEVQLNGAALEADLDGRTSYIATADVTGTVAGPDGIDLPDSIQPTNG